MDSYSKKSVYTIWNFIVANTSVAIIRSELFKVSQTDIRVTLIGSYH